MRPLLSPKEMAAADEATISSGVPTALLMERAGRAVARAVVRVAGRRYGKRVAVVCGKGSNGGDGYVAARRLAGEGVAVTCLSMVDPSEVGGAARQHLDRLVATGTRLEPFAPERLRGADVIVDALFGTGFRGRVEGDPAKAIEAVNDSPAPVVAVDIPSGVDGTTGTVAGPAVRAALTVAMGAEKWGTAVSTGAILAGEVEVVDIGIDVGKASVFMGAQADVARILPRRGLDSHKRSAGAVAVLAGSEGMSGAALLTARGAARMGAGYVTLGTSADVERAKAAVLPEVVSQVVTDGALGPEALERFGSVLERAQSLALGPGLGRGPAQQQLALNALQGVDLPLALDADGLNVLSGHADELAERSAPTVITPHPAELARLLDSSTEDVQSDRLTAARAAADRLGCTVLLKGFRTVVAAPHASAVVNPTGGPELASAGTGDVLTGAVAALLAAGIPPFEAAWAAAYVHGVAGSLAARSTGGPGVLAWDVAEALPPAMGSIIDSE